jgi:Zn-dependent membrane protease YugP
MASESFMVLGIVLYAAVTLFQLVTLPVEFNASSRALKALDARGILSSEQKVGAKKVLSAAALTYVAALLTSLLTLLRLVLLASNRNSRR